MRFLVGRKEHSLKIQILKRESIACKSSPLSSFGKHAGLKAAFKVFCVPGRLFLWLLDPIEDHASSGCSVEPIVVAMVAYIAGV
jgi:hypothetical protein